MSNTFVKMTTRVMHILLFFFREHTLFSAGASHHDDTLYVFRQSFNFPVIETSSPDSHVVDELTAIWYNFARYGYVFIFRRQR